MSLTRLDDYANERDQLLAAITGLLANDARVTATWLFGSLGRGDGDALSDIDLWVVVDDSALAEIAAQPQQYTAQVGSPLFSLEAPQNAPESGVYLMACYDAPAAPHIVDWYWQAQSAAHVPGQARLLFDRVGLPHQDLPPRFAQTPREGRPPPDHTIRYFWMMLMIAAKYAWREPWAETLELLPYVTAPLLETCRSQGLEPAAASADLPPHALPAEKVELLRSLARQMRACMQAAEPASIAAAQGASRYLDLIAALLPGAAKE